MRKTYTISEVIEREKIVHKNQKQSNQNNENHQNKEPSKIYKIIERSIIIAMSTFTVYIVVFVFFASTSGFYLGKDYKYEYFFDGYRITHNGTTAIHSDVISFKLEGNFIIGKIQPSQGWGKRESAHVGRYFVLDKQTNAKSMYLTEEELESLCEKLNIESCELNELSVHRLWFNSTYWYMRFIDE